MIFKIIWFFRFLIYRVFFLKSSFIGYLGKPIYLSGLCRVSLGKRVRFLPNLRLEVLPSGRLAISKNVSVQQNVHITCGGDMSIGENSLILANVFITDIEHTYQELNISPLDKHIKIMPTTIGDNCFIGMGAAIQAGTTLGHNCVVGANSVVRGSFPDNCVIAGVPAKIIKIHDHNLGQWVRFCD